MYKLCFQCNRRPALVWRNHHALCALCYARAERRSYIQRQGDFKSSQKRQANKTKIDTLGVLIRDLILIYRNHL